MFEGSQEPETIADALVRRLRRFVYLTDLQYLAIALWIIHTYAIDAFLVTPYLHFSSAEPGSGKTRALEVLEVLVPNAWRESNPSDAVVYRATRETEPFQLLLDETDAIFDDTGKNREALRSMFNVGLPAGRFHLAGRPR